MEEMDESEARLAALFDRDFIFEPDINNDVPVDSLKNERPTSVTRKRRVVMAGGLVAVAVACASLETGNESHETLSSTSTTLSTALPAMEALSTTSTIIVETTVPRTFNCNGDNIIQEKDTLFKIVKYCNEAGGNFTIDGLAAANSITDPSVIFAHQHITTATTQPVATEVTTTLPPETTEVTIETVPPEVLPVETLPAETVPADTTIPPPSNDGTYSKAECEKIGVPVEFKPGDGGAWEVLRRHFAYNGITLYQIGRVMKSTLPDELRFRYITASSAEFPIYECMPSWEQILAVAPLAAPPA